MASTKYLKWSEIWHGKFHVKPQTRRPTRLSVENFKHLNLGRKPLQARLTAFLTGGSTH